MINYKFDIEEISLSEAPTQHNKPNKHRQDILKNILSKGEREEEARRNNN